MTTTKGAGPSGSAPYAAVLERLDRPRRTGSGYVARCPAHEDRSPSLSISEGEDGRVLLCCFAGCRTEEVVRALGLELRDLFPDSSRQLPPRPRREPVSMPLSVAEILTESSEFAFSLGAAKALASLEPQQQRQDILGNWDYLTRRGDVPMILQLAHLIRGVALFRYGTGKAVEDPHAIRNAVQRLLEERDETP